MNKVSKVIFDGVVLLITILLFTVVDYAIHGLSSAWSVPDYYFKNKIPFGFLLGVIGLFLARKTPNVWLKAFTVAGIVTVALQLRYFIEGYAFSFVLLFLLFHFAILYILSVVMFTVLKEISKY